MIVTKKKLIFYYGLALLSITLMLITMTNFFSNNPFQKAHPEFSLLVIVCTFSMLRLHGNYLKNRNGRGA